MEITHYRAMVIFKKLPFQCAETSPISSSLKSVFEKQFYVCGTTGLVRTVCLTVEMKMCSVERVLVFKLVPESLVPLKPSEIETKKSWFSRLVFSKGAISKLLLPLFQNESWCATFHIEMVILCKVNSFPFENLCTRTISVTEVKSNSDMAYRHWLQGFLWTCDWLVALFKCLCWLCYDSQ